MSRHTHSHFIEIGREEVEARISFTVDKGYAGDRIDPPCPPSAEIQYVQIVIKGQKHYCPKWLSDLLSADEGIHNDLLLEAGEDEAAWADERDEMRREAA